MATETQIIETYNGKKVTFYPNSHRYKDENGEILLPSSIVKTDKSDILLAWNDNLIRDYAEQLEDRDYAGWEIKKVIGDALELRKTAVKEAQDTGTIVHNFAEASAYARVANTNLPEIPEDADDKTLSGIKAFLSFEALSNIEYLDAERFVYSENCGVPYVGRFDAIASINGMRYLLDYKTSKSVYDEHYFQLAGYDIAAREDERIPSYDAIAVLHFDKETGIPTLHVLNEDERHVAREVFIAMLKSKHWQKQFSNMIKSQ